MTSDATAATAAAMTTYQYNIAKRATVLSDTISFQLINGNTEMTSTGDATLAMPFMAIAHVPSLPLLKTDGSENQISKFATGGSSNIEIAIMIDNTGSMCETSETAGTGVCGSYPDRKIDVVKLAAQEAVSILIWPDQSKYTSKVAIIPFSYSVNLGSSAMATAARGAIKSGTSTTPGYQVFKANGYSYYAAPTCVTERLGADKYDDVSPSVSAIGRLYVSAHSGSTGTCPTAAVMQPLTSDTTTLNNMISTMSAGGSTAGHLGTAWAWYALSPNFSSVWSAGGYPSSSTGAPYSQLTQINSQGQPTLRKVAILMTDGDYNSQYCSGVGNWDNGGYYCNGDNGSSQSQAGSLCTAMKAKGIEVFTIGAMVSSTAKAFLTSCATDSTHYYDAQNTTQLEAAFVNIAEKLVPPFLTH